MTYPPPSGDRKRELSKATENTVDDVGIRYRRCVKRYVRDRAVDVDHEIALDASCDHARVERHKRRAWGLDALAGGDAVALGTVTFAGLRGG